MIIVFLQHVTNCRNCGPGSNLYQTKLFVFLVNFFYKFSVILLLLIASLTHPSVVVEHQNIWPGHFVTIFANR